VRCNILPYTRDTVLNHRATDADEISKDRDEPHDLDVDAEFLSDVAIVLMDPQMRRNDAAKAHVARLRSDLKALLQLRTVASDSNPPSVHNPTPLRNINNTLPQELLSSIFLYALVNTRTDHVASSYSFPYGFHISVRHLYRIMHTCRLWRHTAISTPQLWTTYPVYSKAIAPEFLRNCGNLPLDVRLDGAPIELLTETLSSEDEDEESGPRRFPRRFAAGASTDCPEDLKFTENMRFLRSKAIHTLIVDCSIFSFVDYFAEDCPISKSLVALELESTWASIYIPAPTFPFNIQFPKLVHLFLKNVGVPLHWPALSGLTHLTLEATWFPQAIDAIFKLLAKTKNLQILEIALGSLNGNFPLTISVAERPEKRVTLTHLQEARFNGCELVLAAFVMAGLDCPDSTALFLRSSEVLPQRMIHWLFLPPSDDRLRQEPLAFSPNVSTPIRRLLLKCGGEQKHRVGYSRSLRAFYVTVPNLPD
jgi:hypothetical protein